MQRDLSLYVEDILDAVTKIQAYTANLTYEEFRQSDILLDAVIRNLVIIGKAISKFPKDVKNTYSHIPWEKIQSLSVRLIEEYHAINAIEVWFVLDNAIPEIKKSLSARQIKFNN